MSGEKKTQAQQGHNSKATAAVFTDILHKGYNPSAVSQVFTQLAQGASGRTRQPPFWEEMSLAPAASQSEKLLITARRASSMTELRIPLLLWVSR